MSLASWKREFYRISADKVSRRNALKHSLKKWVGLLSRNRKKHRVDLIDGILRDDEWNTFSIDIGSCALCKHYFYDCEQCPIVNCEKQFDCLFDNRVVPMINLLRKALQEKKTARSSNT